MEDNHFQERGFQIFCVHDFKALCAPSQEVACYGKEGWRVGGDGVWRVSDFSYGSKESILGFTPLELIDIQYWANFSFSFSFS